MAFTNATRSSQYIGNGATTAFPTGFYFLQNSDVVVTVTSTSGVDSVKSEGTHYTLTGALSPTGGSVTMLSVPASGEKVTIERLVPLTQETDYVSGDSFPAETHEQGLDKAMMAASQSADQSGRSFRVRGSDGEIAEMSIINSGVVGTSASGVPKMLSGTEIQELLNLPATVIDQPTKTFTNAASRAAATPDFLGQVGVQVDTVTIYTGTSIAAGGWTAYDFTLASGSVGTTQLAANAVTTAKVLDANITAAKLASDSVTTAKILDANVTTAKLADGSVTQAKAAAGMVVNTAITGVGDWLTSTSVIPFDDTLPLITEGAQILTTTYTPLSNSNKAIITLCIPMACASSGATPRNVAFALFKGSTCIGTAMSPSLNAAVPGCVQLCISDIPGGAVTYSVRFGPTAAGTAAINGTTSGRIFAITSIATLTIQEIKV